MIMKYDYDSVHARVAIHFGENHPEAMKLGSELLLLPRLMGFHESKDTSWQLVLQKNIEYFDFQREDASQANKIAKDFETVKLPEYATILTPLRRWGDRVSNDILSNCITSDICVKPATCSFRDRPRPLPLPLASIQHFPFDDKWRTRTVCRDLRLGNMKAKTTQQSL